MVFFDFDSATLNAKGTETVKAFARAARDAATNIGIIGHADRSGSETYNLRLSLQRVETIKDMLIRLGITPATIKVVSGRGESQPLVQTKDGVREPQNRRAELIADYLRRPD